MHYVSQKLVPKMLSAEQKETKMTLAGDMISMADENGDFLNKIIAGDETWCYLYDPVPKRQSSEWKSKTSPRKQKFPRGTSKGKVMLEVFFDSQGLIHHEFIPEGSTVTKELYVEILRRLRDALACCCGSAACSLCCSACPSCRNSTSSRIMYAVMLLLGTIAACITLSPGLEDALKKVPFCSSSNDKVTSTLNLSFECESAVGYLAVYRICFALSAFFFLMALVMIGVKTSKDPRAGIQNGATFVLQLQKLHVVFTRKPKVACCTLLFVLRNPSAAKVATGGCESVHTQGATFAAAVMLQVSISVLTSQYTFCGYVRIIKKLMRKLLIYYLLFCHI
ncbi:hypothetical protein ANN_25298 [Periplaneta americana]|uniref:Uncharacterized protein n=1 Tax=Periplaneta americana TaxID=6978 RepID=A0ABQ8S1K2_PERAM|nr:hypothetical protein ANN_25298 [Periplaneta americana]